MRCRIDRLRGRAGVVALLMCFGLSVTACATTVANVKTAIKDGREAQRNYEQGRAKYDAGDHAGAVPHFQRSLSLDPQFDDAEAYLAWSHYHLGKYPDATRHFRQLVGRQPRWESAWNGLGWSRYRVARYQLAMEAFQEAMVLDPGYRDAAIGLAYTLFELGRYSDALPHLERLTREGEGRFLRNANGDVEELRAKLSWTLYYLGSYERARIEFEKGLRARPEWYGLHNGLGWTHLKLADRAKARDSFQRALRLKPDYADARNGLLQASR